MAFYSYIWHDEQMLPYYVGKGCRDRAFKKHWDLPIPPKSRIVIQQWESEDRAHAMEKWWIAFYGRKDLGTGLLLNRDEGGRSPSQRVCREAGLKNVESGHIFKIATHESRSKGGSVAVTTGRITSIATPESRRNGGRTAGAKNIERGHLPRISALGNHHRWHVTRGIKSVECKHCV